jgi:hypothetical protein
MHQRARTDPSGGRGATRVPTGTHNDGADDVRSRSNCSICRSLGNFSTRPPCNGSEERYLIVAFTVITDVPEAVGP